MIEYKLLTRVLVLQFITFPQAAFAQTGSQAKLQPCRNQPALIGKCFTVRGRLSLYNGAPTVRLWRAGTKRMLGVSASYAQEGYSSIPEELEKQLTWENELWGDFLVCPFTPQRPKEMQLICIERGKNVVARKRR
jgi:hypothetical protein